MINRTALAMLVVAGLHVIGCSRAVVDAPNPIAIAPAEYHRIFDASVEVLRDYRFVVDRKDRRFGVITTEPLRAASAFEPWAADNTTPAQVAANTLQYQRRTVRVEIHRLESREPAKSDDQHARDALATAIAEPHAIPGSTTAGDTAEFELQVIVTLERRHHPPQQLLSPAIQTFDYRKPKQRYWEQATEDGLEQSYWPPAGRDPMLEKRLIAAILRRATFNTNPSIYDQAIEKK